MTVVVLTPETVPLIAERILAQRKAQGIKVPRASERFKEFGRKYYNRRADFLRDILPWPNPKDKWADYQLDMAAELDYHDRLAGRSLRGAGKTALEAGLVHHWALSREAMGIPWKGITTASIGNQLSVYLWPEIHKLAHNIQWREVGRGPYQKDRELMSMRLRLDHGQWSAIFSPEESRQEGAHEEELFLIFTEAKIIPDGVWDSAEGFFLSTGVGKWMALSTPADEQGRFYEIFSRRPGTENWATRYVTQEEAIEAKRVNPDALENIKNLWGKESALYQTSALGMFASMRSAGLISLSWVEQAIERWYAWQEAGAEGQRVTMGVDVGGGAEGGDESVIATATAGYQVDELVRIPVAVDPSQATMELTGRVKGLIDRLRTIRHLSVDVIGVGSGVVHRLREMGYRVFAFHAGMGTKRRDISGELGMQNVRAASWQAMRELLDPQSKVNVALPPDDDLKGELTAPRIKRITSSGLMVVEDKDEIKKRLHRSTNCADAVIMALTGVLFEKEQTEDGAFEVYYR